MKTIHFISAAIFSAAFISACTGNDANGSSEREDSIRHAQAMAATEDTANFTTIQWIDSTSQDIGDVQQGRSVQVRWKFRNAGDKPLIIARVQPGCGCTVAEQPKEPIAPGKESSVSAIFNSEGQHEGAHTKVVSVSANTNNGTYHNLQFRVNVVK